MVPAEIQCPTNDGQLIILYYRERSYISDLYNTSIGIVCFSQDNVHNTYFEQYFTSAACSSACSTKSCYVHKQSHYIHNQNLISIPQHLLLVSIVARVHNALCIDIDKCGNAWNIHGMG